MNHEPRTNRMPIKIDQDMERLLLKQNVAVVGTCSAGGLPNLSLKGVVKVDPAGFICFLDLYRGKTRRNLEENPRVSLVVFNVPEFRGYQFIGKAELIKSGPLFEETVARWKKKKAALLSQRIVANIRKGHSSGRSELSLPIPKYLVRVRVEKIHNLVPAALRDRD